MSEPAAKGISAVTRVGEVAEFQGLYGAYHVSETLLQKVWLRGEFDAKRARTEAGEVVHILHPGTWNRLSGPDFCGAKLVIGDQTVTGDVEIHFKAEAWSQHGHDRDPAYDNVVLHVVLFPPAPGAAPMRTRQGRELPVLGLVDLLWHDLEEYVADEAVTALGGQDCLPVVEELVAMSPVEQAATLRDAAARRWREKVHFAGLRVQRFGWEEACHQAALEILGYRSNRAAMLRVAWAFPWADWRERPPEIESLVAVAAGAWTLRGVRPANHPRLRLAQYLAWMARVPNWPERLRPWQLPAVPVATRVEDAVRARKEFALARVRESVADRFCGMQLGGARLDTWMCNLFFPFLALREAAPAAEASWRIWYPGDAPDALVAAARHLRPSGGRAVLTHGTLQALLGLQLNRARLGPEGWDEAKRGDRS